VGRGERGKIEKEKEQKVRRGKGDKKQAGGMKRQENTEVVKRSRGL
jgi:hypothetical protein